jgi:hypothetical protein
MHFIGTELVAAVSSRAPAKVYKVGWSGRQIKEIVLET